MIAAVRKVSALPKSVLRVHPAAALAIVGHGGYGKRVDRGA